MLYNQKHYPVNEFSWDAAGEIYNVGEDDIAGVNAGVYAREEHDGTTSLEQAVLEETTTKVGIVPVTADQSTEETNDYETSDGASSIYLTADQLNSLNSSGINADGFLSADAKNVWNDLIDHSQSWEPTNIGNSLRR